jgi:cytochrome c
MTRPPCRCHGLACLALLTFAMGHALAADGSVTEIDGEALLMKNCGRCHFIEATGESPLTQAPPLRAVYLKYPLEKLEFELAEGMGSKHRDMPQIQFSSEQVDAILDYLRSIAGQTALSKGAPLTQSIRGSL